ncbi:hypothetical protein [Flavisolibacter nicotianae]|uniref:hypothetical protein n=1 Tax=Flavisolibacter nicotianae TaxID=2364882 RepID=UPI000EAD36DB|nr:hypothetical protein [Flavisolibacter nicotianae]
MPAKAFQAMAVTAISALSHTVYHAESHKQNENEPTGLQATAPVSAIKMVTAKRKIRQQRSPSISPAIATRKKKPGKANPTCTANAMLNKNCNGKTTIWTIAGCLLSDDGAALFLRLKDCGPANYKQPAAR